MAKGRKKRHSSGRKSSGLGPIVAVAVGAGLAAIGGVIASGQGIAPGTVATTAALVGAAGMYFGRGNIRTAAGAVAAVGIGSAAITWWRKGEAERQRKAIAARTGGGAVASASEVRQGQDDLADERLRRAKGDRNWSAVRRSA